VDRAFQTSLYVQRGSLVWLGVMIAWHMILIKYSLHCSFSALGRCAVRDLHVGFEREGVV
jgi:hypothetical protein